MAHWRKSFILLTLILGLILSVKSQSGFLVGGGFSSQFTSINNLTIQKYLPIPTNGKIVETSKSPYTRLGFSIYLGKHISPSFIFISGIQKVDFGAKLNIKLQEFDYSTFIPQTNYWEYNLNLKLSYIKTPITLYWKQFKSKPFGSFISLGFNFGFLTSATLDRNETITNEESNINYKDQMNSVDVHYELMFGFRYDTEKNNINLGLGLGDGLSDIEKKEKIGVTTQSPTQNLFIGFFINYMYKL